MCLGWSGLLLAIFAVNQGTRTPQAQRAFYGDGFAERLTTITLGLWRCQNRLTFLYSCALCRCVVLKAVFRASSGKGVIERGQFVTLRCAPPIRLSNRRRDDVERLQEPRQLRRRSAQVATRDIATPQCRPRFAFALDQRQEHIPGGDLIHFSRGGNFADGCPELGAGIFAMFGWRLRCF